MYKYFTLDEFACKETGENNISEGFVHKLDELREACGFPFTITSGYRSLEHSAERHKPQGGWHTRGLAADIRIHNGQDRYTILQKALELGFTGIGVAKTFVHVDIRDTTPVVWSY